MATRGGVYLGVNRIPGHYNSPKLAFPCKKDKHTQNTTNGKIKTLNIIVKTDLTRTPETYNMFHMLLVQKQMTRNIYYHIVVSATFILNAYIFVIVSICRLRRAFS